MPAQAPKNPDPQADDGSGGTLFAHWRPRLEELADGLRERTLDELRGREGRSASRGPDPLEVPVSRGVGDWTYGIDAPAEAFLTAWQRDVARREPISLLTEDAGWRHLGPGPDGGAPVELDGFDHGGPRIAVDPIDGTRNLMTNLRSAWTVLSFADPGPAQPTYAELTGGLVSELPTTREGRFRRFTSDGRTTELAELDVATGAGQERRLTADTDDRADHGYFPFFRYDVRHRPALCEWEQRFLLRLEEHEGAALHTVYDDQYVSNAGQLACLMLGSYRMIVDARALLARRLDTKATTTKPYDVGGAFVCARGAGCVVTRADGSPLAFPIDAATPLDFCGYANQATYERLAPHWREASRELPAIAR